MSFGTIEIKMAMHLQKGLWTWNVIERPILKCAHAYQTMLRGGGGGEQTASTSFNFRDNKINVEWAVANGVNIAFEQNRSDVEAVCEFNSSS